MTASSSSGSGGDLPSPEHHSDALMVLAESDQIPTVIQIPRQTLKHVFLASLPEAGAYRPIDGEEWQFLQKRLGLHLEFALALGHLVA